MCGGLLALPLPTAAQGSLGWLRGKGTPRRDKRAGCHAMATGHAHCGVTHGRADHTPGGCALQMGGCLLASAGKAWLPVCSVQPGPAAGGSMRHWLACARLRSGDPSQCIHNGSSHERVACSELQARTHHYSAVGGWVTSQSEPPCGNCTAATALVAVLRGRAWVGGKRTHRRAT